MGFLNATLLLGLAASAVPIALHLLGRREPKRFEFPAIRFLTQRFETNRRRMRFRHLALLVLRVVALAGLALALAQPHVHSDSTGTWLSIGAIAIAGVTALAFAAWGFASDKPRNLVITLAAVGTMLLFGSSIWGLINATGRPAPIASIQSPSVVAIVVDNSPRMHYEIRQRSRIEEAQDWAEWIVDHFSEESLLAIVDRSARPITAAIDVTAARRAIRRLKPIQVMQPLSQRIESALAFVRSSKIEQRAVYILTDLAKESWDYESINRTDTDVNIHVIDIGAERPQNRSLGNIKIASPVVARGKPTTVSVSAKSVGELSSQKVSIELRLYPREPSLPVQRDGATVYPTPQTVDRQSVIFSEHSAAEVSLTIPALEPGTHHAEVVFSESDALALDNIRFLTLSVAQPPKVLLISDNANEQTVIKNALELPNNAGGVDYIVDTISSSQVEETDLSVYRTIGILDPPHENLKWQPPLLDWVRGGGSLFLSLGPAWTNDDETIDLPDPLVGDSVRQWRTPAPGRVIEIQNVDHPVVSPFSSYESKVPWQSFPVSRYWQIQRQDADIVIAGYAGTQHPALLERKIQSGRLLLTTTPLPAVDGASRRWNELFTGENSWPAFLLIRGVFAYMGNRDPGTTNVVVGQPVGLTQEVGTRRYQLFAPDMPPVAVDADGKQISPGTPTVAGNYWLRNRDSQPGYSANLPPESTDLQRLGEDELNKLFGEERFQLVRERDQIDWTPTSGMATQPFYAQMMLLVCGVFMLEQLLSNRFYSQR